MRYPHTSAAELAEIRASIVERLTSSECTTRELAEWVGMSRSRTIAYLRALVSGGSVRLARVERHPKGWAVYVWGRA